MTMMEQDATESDDSFQRNVLQRFVAVSKQQQQQQQKHRDPRALRLAAVTAAIMQISNGNTTSMNIYANTVQALEHQMHSKEEDRDSQLALLELLRATVPYVTPAVVGATLSKVSRVLRGMVQLCLSGNTEHETVDELGGINAMLRAIIKCSTDLLRQTAAAATTIDPKLVKECFVVTILQQFHDTRPKVRKAAQAATVELLAIPKNVVLQKTVMGFVQNELKTLSTKKSSKKNNNISRLLHTLAFLENAILHLKIETLGPDLMQVLADLFQLPGKNDGISTQDFVANFSKQSNNAKEQTIHTINAILKVLLKILEQEDGLDGRDFIKEFSARTLASLLNLKPMVIFASSSYDSDISSTGQSLFGKLLLVSSQHVLRDNPKVGVKLFPLALQMSIQQLCKPRPYVEGTSAVFSVAETIMAELTQVFRAQLESSLAQVQSDLAHSCLTDCLKGMEVVLQPIYRPTWSVSLKPLILLVQYCHENSDNSSQEGLGELVEALIQLHSNVSSVTEEEDKVSVAAIEEAIGSLVQGVGIETFWGWIEWQEKAKTNKKMVKKKMDEHNKAIIDPNRAWLLPVIKSSATNMRTSQQRLSFFQSEILALARKCDTFAAQHPAQTIFHQARVVDLWALFPCFCVNPVDVSESFPQLAQTLVRAVGDTRYPQLVTNICGGLKTLASGISERGNEMENGERDMKTMAQLSPKILPPLFKLVETLQGTTDANSSSKEDKMDIEEEGGLEKQQNVNAQRTQSVTSGIAELARLAPPSYLQSLFKKILQRLLAATQSEDDQSEKICTLLGLAQALISSKALDEVSMTLLYRTVKPFIRTDEHQPKVQKRAYKVLGELFKSHPSFATSAERLNELIELLTNSIMTCQVSARHMRLKCMSLIVDNFEQSNQQHMEIIPKVVGECLLCLKDSNAKTREAGYQLLISMAKAMNNMTTYFQAIVGALGAQTSHMRSAAVMAMSRLVFEFAREDDSVHSLLPHMLQTIIVLFDENSREVLKSVVGFVRISVAAMTAEQLEPMLPDLVGGLLKYHRGTHRFRAKIKIIIKKLVRVYGYDRLMPLVPESDTRLLTHMRKLSERAARRKAALKADGRVDDAVDFDEMMESDEDDSDDGRTLMTGATGFTRMTGRSGKSLRSEAVERKSVRSKAASTILTTKSRRGEGDAMDRIKSENDGEIVDMLDPKNVKTVRFANDDDNSDSDDGGMMEFDEYGRLLVPDDLGEDASSTRVLPEDEGEDDENAAIRGGKRLKLSKLESAKLAKAEGQKKKHANKKNVRELGAAYKSKKAGGDVIKKGQKFEPYAYVPLDGKSYSKKNRRQAVEQMSTVVRGGKRKR